MAVETAEREAAAGASPAPHPASGAARQLIDGLGCALAADQPVPQPDPAWLAQALGESGPPLVVRGLDGTVLAANGAFAEISDSLSRAAALPAAADLAAVIEGLGKPYCQQISLKVDGRPRDFLASHHLASGPGGGGVVSCYLPADDVGARLRAFRRSDERLRDIVRLTSDLIWECDADLVLTSISPRVLHLLGYQPHEVIGKPWHALAKDAGGLSRLLAESARRAPFRGLEMRLADRNGEERIYLIHGLPVFDRDSGKHIGFRGTAQDISDQVAHDAALRQAAALAESANRAKGDFLANMSHELRTPLNAIIGFSEVMAGEEFGPLGNERYREYLDNVAESGRHLLSLINQILDLAKIDAGKMRLAEAHVDVAQLTGAVLRLVADTAARRGIRLTNEVGAAPVTLWADESKLKQILLNLLSNALKFTPEGGHVEIRGGLEPGAGYLFQVVDDGFGIDQADFETALAPFGQVDSRLNRKYEGTGLGLPLSKALAEAHGGSLRLDSRPGRGTSVNVSLPAERVVTKS